jgi:hypothetical protein
MLDTEALGMPDTLDLDSRHADAGSCIEVLPVAEPHERKPLKVASKEEEERKVL